jgi:hypothetical protein
MEKQQKKYTAVYRIIGYCGTRHNGTPVEVKSSSSEEEMKSKIALALIESHLYPQTTEIEILSFREELGELERRKKLFC